MSGAAQWLQGARRRGGQQQWQDYAQHTSCLAEQTLLWDAYESKHFDTRRNRLAQHFLSVGKRNCGLCWSQMALSPRWLPTLLVLLAGVALTCGIWLSDDSRLAGVPWPWHTTTPTTAVTNGILIGLAGLGYVLCRPWRSDGRPIMPLQAKTLIFFFWLALNLIWLIGGIRERDFANKPGWLKQTRVPSRAQHFSEPVLRALRLLYNVGMACAWPLLANLFVVLLPVDRTLFLLACLGAGHEEGLLAHTLCGTAVWVWVSAHAILTQAPMLAAGLWRLIVLPPLDGSETKATSNFMGLLAFLGMTALGVSSLARVRRLFFDRFQLLHLVLAPTVLLFGCLHDSKVFWYSFLGAVLYGADLVQRWALRRRAAVATATVYPKDLVAGSQSAATPGGVAVSPGGSKFVVLRVETGCSPGCVAGQHVFIKVPSVSRWEWHPYSVAAHDGHSFAVVVKAGGDWERRLCRAVELTAAAAAGPSSSVKLNVVYEGLYGTADLQAAAASADRVLLFAGGAGITPVAAVLQSLLAAVPPPLPPPSAHAALENNGWSVGAAATNGSDSIHGYGSGLAGHSASAAPTASRTISPTKLDAVGGGGGAVAGLENGVRAAARDAAAAAAAADAVAAAVGSKARVHLVWAVTQQSDAEALMPLLQAAASRGWRVDLHCTRAAPSPSRTSPSAQMSMLCQNDPAMSSTRIAVRHGPGASPGSCSLPDAGAAKAPQAPRAPWQLHGAACWAVAALAALLGAVGANIGGIAASTHSCDVAGPPDAALSSSGGSGASDWASSVRSAFMVASKYGSAVQLHPLDSASPAETPSSWVRLLSILLQGSASPSVFSCPTAVRPVTERLRAAASAGVDAAVKKLKLASVGLRVCRSWVSTESELCVKCDPLKAPKMELYNAWPCCQARVCFFASHLAPLAGWVLGVLLGAALACAVWRWWSLAGRGGGRRRPLLAERCGAGGWSGLAARFGGLDADGKMAAEELTAGLLPDTGDGSGGSASAFSADAAERGRASDACASGLESMVSEMPGLPYGQAAETAGTAASAADGGIYLHTGRPDVDAYIWAAAAAGDATACGRFGREVYGAEVYGLVVCGPESLQEAVQASYERRLRKVYPDSWFRGFSFTT